MNLEKQNKEMKELLFLLKEYVFCDENDLTEDAKVLRAELFEKYVGLHTTYTKNSQGKYVRDLNTVKPQESWEKYYKNDQIVKANYNLITSRDIFGILENPFWSR